MTHCSSTKHIQYSQEKRFTLATIKQLKKGMAQATVLSITGTPNLITSTKSGEQWVYDKIRTEHYDRNTTTQIGGGSTFHQSLLGLNLKQSNNQKITSQKNLTTILYFNNRGILNQIKYNYSHF